MDKELLKRELRKELAKVKVMSTQEKEAFNAQFETYQGEEISGANVKSLLSKLAANYSTYADEPAKVPEVNCNNITSGANASYKNTTDGNGYTSNISTLRNAITNKHTYKVTMNFGPEGVIDSITITDVT